MKRVRKPARSLEAALEIVETGIEKIVAELRAPVPPEGKPSRAHAAHKKTPSRAAEKAQVTI